MTWADLCRKAARALIATAVWISPANTREWTEAMAAEAEYVEGSFGALAWAAGCFGTALKQLCISIISPGAFEIATEGAMSKFAKISAVVLVVGSALFLFAPTFRQGVKLTAASWHQSDAAWLSKMRALGARAEKNNDAQTLAFVALQINGDWNAKTKNAAADRALRDKYADHAVQQDPQWTWIYYPLLNRDHWPDQSDPNDAGWLARLQKWDPNNAAVYAVEAAYYRPWHALGWNAEQDRALLAASPRWQASMAKAFDATTYDSYFSRKTNLDRKISLHDELNDPNWLLFGGLDYQLVDFTSLGLYSKYFLMSAAATAEKKGDLRQAEEDYGKVAHLGGLIELHGDTDLESLVAITLQKSANQHMQAVLEKSGNAPAANLLAFQTELEQDIAHRISSQITPAKLESRYQTTDAWLLQLSLLGLVISLTLLIFCGVYLAIRRMMALSVSHRAGTALAAMSVAATILLFASTIAMYFGYSPYAIAFREYMNASNTRDAYSLLFRFNAVESLPEFWFDSFRGVDFWYTVIAVGAAILSWILCRYLMRIFRHPAPMQPAE